MTTQIRLPRTNGVRRVGEPYDRSMVERAHALTVRKEALDRYLADWQRDRMAWEGEAAAIAEPFDLDWCMLDPAVLDLLAWVQPDGDHWRWTGRTNNKNLPVMRTRTKGTLNTEHSAHRWLHRLLAPGHEPPGAMHPRCDAEFLCVRPAHRCPICML